MTHAPDEFTALIARARQGDEGALADLIRRYEPEVRIAARVRLGPALRPYLDSMDVVHSVHRCLIDGLRKNKVDFSDSKALLAWTVKVVQYKVAHHWRHLRRQQHLSGDISSCDLEELLVSLCTPEDDPARTAEIADQVRCVC